MDAPLKVPMLFFRKLAMVNGEDFVVRARKTVLMMWMMMVERKRGWLAGAPATPDSYYVTQHLKLDRVVLDPPPPTPHKEEGP